MTAKEAKKVSEEIRAYTKELSKLPPKEAKKQAREALVGAGICTKKGELTKPYKLVKEHV